MADPAMVTIVVRLGDREVSRTLAPTVNSTIVVQLDPMVVARELENRITEGVMERLRERWRR